MCSPRGRVDRTLNIGVQASEEKKRKGKEENPSREHWNLPPALNNNQISQIGHQLLHRATNTPLTGSHDEQLCKSALSYNTVSWVLSMYWYLETWWRGWFSSEYIPRVHTCALQPWRYEVICRNLPLENHVLYGPLHLDLIIQYAVGPFRNHLGQHNRVVRASIQQKYR